MQKKQVLVPVLILIGVVVVLFVISLFFRQRETSVREVFKKEIVANLKEGYSVKDTIFESLDNKGQQVAAIIHWKSKDGKWQQDSLVLYDMKGGNLAELFDTTEWVLEFGNDVGGDSFRVEDINKDGLKEFVVSRSQGGNCWTCTYLRIFQVKDHHVIELPADLPDTRVVIGIQDLKGDGLKELLVLDAQWEFYMDLCHACSPSVNLVYKWEKDKYLDRSGEFPSYYDEEIKGLEQEIMDMSADERGTDYYMGRVISIFLNYLEKGEKEKGWEVFKNYMAEENFKEKGFKDMAKWITDDLHKRFF